MSEPSKLYYTEKDCAVALGFSYDAWAELRDRYERMGMPRKDPVSRRRYWPAVRAWFDRHNGLTVAGIQADDVDRGTENPDALRPKIAKRARA